mmetsp:Transcript_902/g.1799  ORF Transcript_902/g.1799 Transcript_902/m.1799 type:complete len:226 (-) Transcript_902:899-1576(-)
MFSCRSDDNIIASTKASAIVLSSNISICSFFNATRKPPSHPAYTLPTAPLLISRSIEIWLKSKINLEKLSMLGTDKCSVRVRRKRGETGDSSWFANPRAPRFFRPAPALWLRGERKRKAFGSVLSLRINSVSAFSDSLRAMGNVRRYKMRELCHTQTPESFSSRIRSDPIKKGRLTMQTKLAKGTDDVRDRCVTLNIQSFSTASNRLRIAGIRAINPWTRMVKRW